MRARPIYLAVALGSLAACRNEPEPPAPTEVAPPAVTAVAAAIVPPRPHIEGITIEPLDPDVREGSGVVLAKVGARSVAFVADADEQTIHTLDLEKRAEIARTFVTGKPERMLIVGDRIAVALRDKGAVALYAVDAIDKPLAEDATMPTADEPIALARTFDGAQLWVASGWGRKLEGFDVRGRHLFARIPLEREPRALTIAANGRHAFVGYMTTDAIDTIGLQSRQVATQPIAAAPPTKMGRATAARQTFALVRAMIGGEEHVVAPHVRTTPGSTDAITSGYGDTMPGESPHVFDLAAFDVATAKVRARGVPPSRPDDCRLPRDAVSMGGSLVAVACLGSDNVKTYDVSSVSRNSTASYAAVGGPHALAFDPTHKQLVVNAVFDRRVWLIPNAANTKPISIALSHVEGRGLSSLQAAGRRLFHRATDTRISKDGRACASCHPDGRDDGLVWPTPDGPRKTMFLAGRLSRAKNFGWEAKHATIPVHLQSTIHNLGGSGLTTDEMTAIAAYCVAMSPPPRTPRALTSEEAHGREIFQLSAGCSGCHGEDTGFTDASAHDVLSANKLDTAKQFLAPSLKYLGGTSLLFHDGRYSSLAVLLRESDGKMGATAHLSKTDLADLESYLQTL